MTGILGSIDSQLGALMLGGAGSVVVGTGAVLFQVPALDGIGIGDPNVITDVVVVGHRGLPFRFKPRVVIEGQGALRLKSPAISGCGAFAITGVGVMAIAGLALEAQGGEDFRGAGEDVVSVPTVSGDGVVLNRLIVSAKAQHQVRSIHGIGDLTVPVAVLTAVAALEWPDAIDTAWTSLQHATDADDEELLILGVFGR